MQGKPVMVRLIAGVFCAFVIWQLFRLNREREVRTSKALWIPTFWLFLAASRNLSEWLHYSPGGAADHYLEGNPLDRAVLSAALALGVVVLLGRSRRTGMLLRSNLPILLYFLYCGTSVLWSDFPDVSFKRWFRAMGDVVMVLIVLSDPDWVVAVRRLFARVGFLVVPLSILFIRYFPELGRTYSHAGAPAWTGVATDKNALGMICLVFGLASIFRFLQVYRGEESTRKTGPLIAQSALIAMTLFLLMEANSATASACFFLAGFPMVLTYLFRSARRPAFMHIMVLTLLGVAFSALFLNLGSGLVQDLGRNSTLTGRTLIWHAAASVVQNPVLGAGYESFWLGPRLAKVQELIHQGVNQAHNGYIEVYLNLGWVVVALLTVFLVNAYRRITTAVRWRSPAASLRLAFFIVAVAYNFSEAGFKMMHPVWITLLLATMMVTEAPLPDLSPPLSHDRADDLAGYKPETARSYSPSNSGRPYAQRAHREDLQRTRKLRSHR
jgi:exopolysaccharide production protein ExoQ